MGHRASTPITDCAAADYLNADCNTSPNTRHARLTGDHESWKRLSAIAFVLLIALNVRALLGVVGSGAIAAVVFYTLGFFGAGRILEGRSRKLVVSSDLALPHTSCGDQCL